MKLYYLLFLLLLVFASCAPVGPNIAIVPDDTFINIGNNVTVKNENGQALNVQTLPNGTVNVATNNVTLIVGDYNHECSKKTVSGCFAVVVNAHNPDVDIATSPEDIWEVGGRLILPQIREGFIARPLLIVSDAINDTLGGNGTRTLLLEGLDINYKPISDTINMNGTSTVETNIPFWRLNRATSIKSGSFGTNVGTITITRVIDPAATWMIVSPNLGISKNSQFTTPRGMTAWFMGAKISSTKTGGGQNPIVNFKFRTRDVNGSWVQRFHEKLDTSVANQLTVDELVQEPIGEGTDTLWEVTSDQNNADVFVTSYYMIDGNTTIGMFQP